MNSADRKVAKIYSFPVRPRAHSVAVRLARLEAEARQRANTDVVYGGAWYHDEAIEAARVQRRS